MKPMEAREVMSRRKMAVDAFRDQIQQTIQIESAQLSQFNKQMILQNMILTHSFFLTKDSD